MQTNNVEHEPIAELEQFGKDIHEIIQEKLVDDDLNLTYICKKLPINERTLFRKVKKLTGTTPAKLIQEARLKKAKAYYESRSFKSVRQLTLAAGFKNTTRFTRKFLDRFGIDLRLELN